MWIEIHFGQPDFIDKNALTKVSSRHIYFTVKILSRNQGFSPIEMGTPETSWTKASTAYRLILWMPLNSATSALKRGP
jgi:hypothetical protein